MSVRITALLDDDVVKKLRLYQAKKIQKSKQGVSFSEVLNEVIKKGLIYN